MAKHLPGKVAQLIGDFRTVDGLVRLIDHEMEKRIVARHGWVKLDALIALLPQLKNEYVQLHCAGNRQKVRQLEDLIGTLRRDVETGPIATVRDAMAGHALKLDLSALNVAWQFMGATTFGVLLDDLAAIEKELEAIAGPAHVPAGTAQVDAEWPNIWRPDDCLGDPSRPRLVTVYPVLATGNVAGPLPGGNRAQDALIRAIGLATFLRQERLSLEVTAPGSVAERLFAEMMVNDFVALWELLFESNIRNVYGVMDQCVLDHWLAGPDPWNGANCLQALKAARHPGFDRWRSEVRNKISAHLDPNIEVWRTDLNHWPMSLAEVINEALRVIEAFRACADLDIRSKVLFMPPTSFGPDVIGLSGQAGKSWGEN